MFHENQIVKGKSGGTFVILGFRSMHGEDGAQLKSVNPENHSEVASGELWLPLADLVPLHSGGQQSIARKITIVIRAETEDAFEDAFDEVVTRLKSGNSSGMDRDDSAGFYFSNTDNVTADEMPA